VKQYPERIKIHGSPNCKHSRNEGNDANPDKPAAGKHGGGTPPVNIQSKRSRNCCKGEQNVFRCFNPEPELSDIAHVRNFPLAEHFGAFAEHRDFRLKLIRPALHIINHAKIHGAHLVRAHAGVIIYIQFFILPFDPNLISRKPVDKTYQQRGSKARHGSICKDF